MNIETKFYRNNEIDNNLSYEAFKILHSDEDQCYLKEKSCKEKYESFVEFVKIVLFDNPNAFLAVTYNDKKLVNFVLVSNESEEKYTFDLVATHFEYRNKGIAYFAEKNCIAKIKDQGGKTIDAYIENKNENSKMLHKKSGFNEQSNKFENSERDYIYQYKLDINNDILNDKKLEK